MVRLHYWDLQSDRRHFFYSFRTNHNLTSSRLFLGLEALCSMISIKRIYSPLILGFCSLPPKILKNQKKKTLSLHNSSPRKQSWCGKGNRVILSGRNAAGAFSLRDWISARCTEYPLFYTCLKPFCSCLCCATFTGTPFFSSKTEQLFPYEAIIQEKEK